MLPLKQFPRSILSFKPQREAGASLEKLGSGFITQDPVREAALLRGVCDRDLTLCNYGGWLRNLCKAIVFVSNAPV